MTIAKAGRQTQERLRKIMPKDEYDRVIKGKPKAAKKKTAKKKASA